MELPTKPESKASSFVEWVITRSQSDTGFAARLRRADNPDTEYQCWDILAGFSINLERDEERLPYAYIGAAIIKAKAETNGKTRLGKAIANCYKDDKGADSEQAKAKLRRLLACSSMPELCRTLRPLFSLISAKSTSAQQTLDYSRLLKQMNRFTYDPQKVKAQWAMEFYNSKDTEVNKDALVENKGGA